MDQIKIGKFIQEKRKEKNITQSELAEILNITDRAISKWENGKCMPDVGIMQELCETLNITINDLFSGEVVNMKDTEKKLEENLLEMTRLKEEKDRQLLSLEIFIGVISSVILVGSVLLVGMLELSKLPATIIITISSILFAIGMGLSLRIEQTAGYYECQNCHHKYIPTYQSILWAQHINRTRKMKCPKCNKKTWHKKVITK
jgi:transcriptional regulator with XRE-family HTH domain/DNA-directed RNA polymerase subunit RPC12/RpoP